jgi:hypothetical protein
LKTNKQTIADKTKRRDIVCQFELKTEYFIIWCSFSF